MILLTLAIGYLFFVIYGSLVPLEFRYLPPNEAWEAFLNIRYFDLDAVGRADWVANILLYIPLSFLWLGVFWRSGSFSLRIIYSLLIGAACLNVSILVEFLQVYSLGRTVSLNDLLAEAVGTILGIFFWWRAGPVWVQWFSLLKNATTAREWIQRIMPVYLFLLVIYYLLPLDLVISPAEIHQKWLEGKIVFTLFGYRFQETPVLIYHSLVIMTAWAPVGFLWQLISGKKGIMITWFYIILTSLLLEFLQIFIYSKVTDVTHVFLSAIGAGAGILFARLISEPDSNAHLRHIKSLLTRYGFWIWLASLFSWIVILAVVFWYPFNFHADQSFARQRILDALSRVPFHTYYVGSEYTAVTQVAYKTGFFFPLGILLSLAVIKGEFKGFWRHILDIDSILFVAFIALVIEFGQVFLPEKHPDTTDLFLETLGGTAGYLLFQMIYRRIHAEPLGKWRLHGSP